MKNTKTFVLGMLIVPLALVGIGVAIAGNVVTPNAFVAGQPAVAAQVNANFAAHATEINDNNTRIVANTLKVNALSGGAAMTGVARAGCVCETTAAGITVVRFFNNVNGAAPTGTRLSTGQYEVDFGFNVASSLWTGSNSAADTLTNPGTVEVELRSGNNDALFIFTRDLTQAGADTISFTILIH